MKYLFTTALTLALGFTAIAGNGSHSVDTKTSKVEWVGAKAKGEHRGLVSISEGKIEIEGNEIKGGNVVIDLTTITCTDMEGEWGDKLVGHLKSADFFNVEAHSTAQLTIKSAGKAMDGVQAITAQLSFNGQSHEIKFNASLNDHNAKATIDLTQALWGITYSGKEDNPIKENFQVIVDLHLN